MFRQNTRKLSAEIQRLKKMKILVTGSNGQAGKELVQKGRLLEFDIIALDVDVLDITNKGAVCEVIKDNNISLCINAAAYTNVDQAEDDIKAAFAVNCDGPENIAYACAEEDIPFIHISTDYVFGGNKTALYIETDQMAPIGIYGKSKKEGEVCVKAALEKHIIIRTSWLYGVYGKNFVKTMLDLGRTRDEISVVCDQTGSPAFAADLADAVFVIADKIRKREEIVWGVYHYCNKGVISWYEFAVKIFEYAKQYESMEIDRVIPVNTKEYPTKAKRPKNSAMDCSLIVKTFGVKQPLWADSLKTMLDRLYILKDKA